MDTNWAGRITDLEGWGWSLKAIAEAVELTTSAISEIKSGRTREPRLSAALKLDALHRAEARAAKRKAA